MSKTNDTKQAATHTPRPWHAEPLQWDHGASIAICSKRQGVLAIIPPLNDADDAVNAQRDPHDVANGELMAAAPAMLEALEAQEMAEWDAEASRRKGYFDRARELRRAALAAVRGTVGAEVNLNPSPTPAPGLPTPFDAYEIHGMKRLPFSQGQEEGPVGRVINDCEQVSDAEAEFWSLFGHIPGQGLDCIGDFATRQHAEEVLARITARPYRRLPRRNR
jgi:hypothetical protein